MRTLVMKFGGSSVGNTSTLTQVVSIVLQEYERWERLLLVVSALEGVTDALIEAAHLAKLGNRRGYRRIAATIRTRHLALVDQLPLDTDERNALQADIDRMLFEMLEICQTMADANAEKDIPVKTDAIIGVGELLAARIIAALLRQNNLRGVAIDATEIIITDGTPQNAEPDMALTSKRINEHLSPMLKRQIIPVITGFIAGTPDGKPTTLGRGGSDYTASIVSVCMDATETWIWSIVDGMMTTDPLLLDSAQVVPELSYDEVAELAYFGARILHARMIAPLKEKNIPLRIKNVFRPQQTGTLIRHMTQNDVHIKSVTSIQGIGLSANRSGSITEISQIVYRALYEALGHYADVMIASQSSSRSFLCFVIPTTSPPEALHTSQKSIERLLQEAHIADVWTVELVGIVTLIGSQINHFAPKVIHILQAIKDIPLVAVSQGPSQCSLSFMMHPDDVDTSLKMIHKAILSTD